MVTKVGELRFILLPVQPKHVLISEINHCLRKEKIIRT